MSVVGMWIRFPPLLFLLLVVCSCTTSQTASTTTVVTTATSMPTTTAESSTTSTIASEPPSYLTYGWDGVTRVVGGVATRLTIEPVAWAIEDGAGGIVFRSVTEEPGWVWLPVGADRPVRIDVGRGEVWVDLVGLVEGRPSIVVARSSDFGTVWCDPPEFVVDEIIIRDLQTGQERFVVCLYQGPDSSEGISSYGGGILTVELEISLIGHTSGPLQFVDLSGEGVAVEHNPFSESCAPCELDAKLSPDGSLLAYAYWPTSSIIGEEPPDGDYTRVLDEWWEASKHIPTELVVVDLETGEERWRSEAPAQTWLDGFDGRYVTVGTDTGRTIHDTVTGEVYTVPPARTEPTDFWVAILDSLDTATHSYADAQRVAAEMTEEYDVETGVLWSDGWATLNPGYWAVFTGGYPTKDEATATCEELRLEVGSCYPRYVATAETIDPEIGRGMIELRADGLGVVGFGDPVEGVIDLLTILLGLPSSDRAESPWSTSGECFAATGYPCDDYFRVLTWDEPGLSVLFSDDVYLRTADDVPFVPDGKPHFAGWLVEGATGFRLTTPDGVGVGSSVQELREVYGEEALGFSTCRVVPPIGWYVVFAGYRGYLSGDQSNPDVVLTGLRSGIRPNC